MVGASSLTRRSSGQRPAGIDCAFLRHPARRSLPLSSALDGKAAERSNGCGARRRAPLTSTLGFKEYISAEVKKRTCRTTAMPYNEDMRTVAETEVFQRYATEIWKDVEREQFVDWIAANPEAGPLIAGS